MGLTGNLGAGGYITGGIQYAQDWHGNGAIYLVGGNGVGGPSARGTFSVGYLNVPTAGDAGGFGTEVGATVGEIIVAGASLIASYDEDGEYAASGGVVNVGLGVEGAILEGHTSMTKAIKLFEWNYYDIIDDFYFFLDNLFDGSANMEMCKD